MISRSGGEPQAALRAGPPAGLTRVPQDPSDEPASELLKRIAAERAQRERLAKEAKSAVKKQNKADGATPRRGRKSNAAKS